MLTGDQGIDASSEALDSIEQWLSRSAAAWNAGDLRGFHACYTSPVATGSRRKHPLRGVSPQTMGFDMCLTFR
jgi:hypothetical protein